jgi:lipoprotein-anchoring transpeptidase ErfK/SrfK
VARRVGLILCLVVCALGAGTSLARADGTPSATTIPDGVQIGSVVVGGMTSEDATAAVQTAYFAPLVVHVGHRNVSVSPHHFHTALDDAATAVQTALTAAPDTVVPLKPTYDMQRIVKWVHTLSKKTDRAPVAGTVILRSSRPVLTHSHLGRKLLKFPTRMRIRAAILSGARTTILAPLKTITATAAKAAPTIVIHRGSNRLYLYQGTRFVRAFPVATGQPAWPTPLGHFEIVVKQVNPWWYPPTNDSWAAGAKPVPPGPGNPLGTRWMGLSAPGVGIHGTSEPWSIGHSESHGCIRMQIPSAEWLYTHVQIGTPVFIIPS